MGRIEGGAVNPVIAGDVSVASGSVGQLGGHTVSSKPGDLLGTLKTINAVFDRAIEFQGLGHKDLTVSTAKEHVGVYGEIKAGITAKVSGPTSLWAKIDAFVGKLPIFGRFISTTAAITHETAKAEARYATLMQKHEIDCLLEAALTNLGKSLGVAVLPGSKIIEILDKKNIANMMIHEKGPPEGSSADAKVPMPRINPETAKKNLETVVGKLNDTRGIYATQPGESQLAGLKRLIEDSSKPDFRDSNLLGTVKLQMKKDSI